MKSTDIATLLLFGLVFWILGTLYYASRGHIILETTALRYWINFIATPILSAEICFVLLRVRHIPLRSWASASLLIALPGIFGEVLILARFTTYMPRMLPETAGSYGAFLFMSYGLLLAISEAVTLRAANQT